MRTRDFSVHNAARCISCFNHGLNDWSPLEWGGAAAGEMGELCNLLKKKRRGENVDNKAIADEIADTITYLDLLAQSLGIDMGDALISKFNVVSARVGYKLRLPQQESL